MNKESSAELYLSIGAAMGLFTSLVFILLYGDGFLRDVPLWFNTITYPGWVVGYEFYGQCKSSGMSHQFARYASMASGTAAMWFAGAILGGCTYGVVQLLSKRL
ncbi:MAG: hypothetical protein DSY81_03795 [Bacillota bacterium]|nr:MAG: hypothetical protein DSY81_03795 [Bacillota bacterium]